MRQTLFARTLAAAIMSAAPAIAAATMVSRPLQSSAEVGVKYVFNDLGGGRRYRSKGKPQKRKLRRNLVTHSRRVRRKHRRAA